MNTIFVIIIHINELKWYSDAENQILESGKDLRGIYENTNKNY